MIKTTYSTILLSIAFLALMLTLTSARLMAQTVEVQRSVTSSTTEAPPVEQHRSVESSTSSTSSTTEAPPPKKPDCASQCRDHYDRSMTECNQPDHPDRKDCEKWAREREKECLEKCYRK